MLKLTNARISSDGEVTQTKFVLHGTMDEIQDLMEDISENQNVLEFEGGEYYVTQMEARSDKEHGYTRSLSALELLVRPLDSIY